MKLSEFTPRTLRTPLQASDSNTAVPSVLEVSEPSEEPQYTTSTTPSGIEVYYSWAPRRHYKLRSEAGLGLEWAEIPEVPSVTSVLGVLDKSGPLTWWSQGVACEAFPKLVRRNLLSISTAMDGELELFHTGGCAATKDSLVDLLVSERLSCNHVKDSAADRGVNVHGALERWIEQGDSPWPPDWPEHERGYVAGVADFISAIDPSLVLTECESELMVGSLEHQYAGRFDLALTLDKPVEVVTRHYPKRKDKVEEIPAGRYLMDLKTRKKAAVYNTNYLQLEAYEAAAVECGYAPTDYRAVIVVTEDGGYQVSVNQDWVFDDFLAVRRVYSVLNEREILRTLREDLGAVEVNG